MTTTLDTGPDVSIDLRRALRWRWPVLFAAAIVGVVVGSFVAAQRPQEYEATAVTAIVPARSDSIPGADYVSLAAPSFIAFATSPAKLQEIARAVGVDAGDLQSSVNAAVQGTSNTITVTARSGSPLAATRAANAIAYAMTRFRDGSQVTRAVMVASATPPDAPRAGAAGLLRGAGLLGGIAAGIAMVWLLERRRPHVAHVADIELATASGCLGTLPRSASLRRKGPERSNDPTVEAAGRLLVTGLLARLPGRAVVLVTSPRRGAGASTVAAVLAYAAALVGRKVVLVRPVPQKASDPDVASTSAVIPEALEGRPAFLEVPDSVARSERRVAEGGFLPGLREVASDALDRFDIVVIDAPPILQGRWRRDGAGLADGIVLVASAGEFFDRVRTAAVLASSLAPERLVAIGNRMPWSTPPVSPDELAVQGEES
jgi:succinoglycan biosynthesis transport protein ExoP